MSAILILHVTGVAESPLRTRWNNRPRSSGRPPTLLPAQLDL